MQKEKYNFKKIEKKWQKKWQDAKIFETKEDSKKEKFYCLDMFPYPSGSGLHVGHPKGYIATDIVARYKMLSGFNVLHPMGFDSFGLPAENFAIKNKIHPQIAVNKNIEVFKKQLEKFGFTYDWNRQVITSDPNYYKWTQWIFLKLFEKGLVYESFEPINWCPSCKTGLANEDLENGKCERCGSDIEKKPMRQWVLRMTDYAEKLLDDLKLVDWEKSIIDQQINWIGKSEGAEIKFKVKSGKLKVNYELNIFTTRPDTLFGATYMVVAPEHEIIKNQKSKIKNQNEIEKYVKKAKNKSDLERAELQKQKTGVEIKGIKAINPANNEEIPIFVADYVLPHYGTGAIMAVPAHDERDWEFAKKYNLPVKEVIRFSYERQEGPDAVKKNLPLDERVTLVCVIKHWKDNKYLGVHWTLNDWHGFVTGGVANNEDYPTAGIREIQEETGYSNIEFIKTLGFPVDAKFYQSQKNVNRWAHYTPLLFKLKDGKTHPIDEAEKKLHKLHWLTPEEMDKFLNRVSIRLIWQRVLGNDCFTGEGILINSGKFNGMTSEKARNEITKFVNGKNTTKYKMRDWVFSRQRYWGEPFPLVFCKNCAEKLKNKNLKLKAEKFSKGELLNPGWITTPEDQLPIKLPEVKSYEPTGTGESPLANINKWVNTTCPKCGGQARRETNTMPQWAGSSWYYLRYCDPKNNKRLANSDKLKYWLEPKGVDLYVGGAEHATRHLLYARFWHKFLYDLNVVSTKEPFYRLQHVGLIRGEDGRKMSKRWGNVINPDDVIKIYGADALRCYEMFMGPFVDSISWSTAGVKGVYRFLEKVWKLNEKAIDMKSEVDTNSNVANLLNKTIKKVADDIESFRFNTAISTLMILVNEMNSQQHINLHDYKILLRLLSPFAPHISEELWEKSGETSSIFTTSWPKFQDISEEKTKIVIQINGKVRANIEVNISDNQDEVFEIAKKHENVKKYLSNMPVKKIVYIPGKIFSIVI